MKNNYLIPLMGNIFKSSLWELEEIESKVRGDFIPLDIKESENSYTVHADLPGADKKDINVEMKDGVLQISTQKNIEKEEKTENYLRKERVSNFKQRFIDFGKNVDNENVSASYKDGVLNIEILKTNNKARKVIEVT